MTELKTTKPEDALKDWEEPFFINGVKVGYDPDHTFNIAIPKDVAETKYKGLIDRGILTPWDAENDYMWEDSPEDLEQVRQHYWHWSSLIHPLDENLNCIYGEMEDDEHFAWLGIDEDDINEEYCDIGNG